MRLVLACLLIVAAPAWAQAPAAPAAALKSCPDCGVVRSVRTVVKESKPAPTDSAKPSGLVASVPLGPGAGKPTLGSSSHIGKDAVTTVTTWEVIVRLDDGRVSILTLDEAPDVREGDKVRIEKGQLVRRSD
jgi:hypothetical protein